MNCFDFTSTELKSKKVGLKIFVCNELRALCGNSALPWTFKFLAYFQNGNIFILFIIF